jgi:predicted transcriptional regulator of viral defense system
MISEKQKAIIARAQMQGGVISTCQAIETIGKAYYHNEAKHTGEVLSRMVKVGLLARVQRGVYQVVRTHTRAKATTGEGQTTMF